jgi:DNA polymerase kappa
LVLKIKLHTYEILTRQVTPPKAVCLADDLYNYSLPMLAKYEKEIPNMKLRLMGLRCTNLISTEKYSGNFFGPRSQNQSKRREDTISEDGAWEVWPDAEFEDAARQERQDEIDELERLSQEHENTQSAIAEPKFHEPFGRYKYGSMPNSPAKPKDEANVKEKEQEQFWDCPVCMVPQAANDRAFNDHIDICLSRETIKEAVADAAISGTANSEAEMTNRPRSAAGKRKAAVGPGDDRRQKRLFFT